MAYNANIYRNQDAPLGVACSGFKVIALCDKKKSEATLHMYNLFIALVGKSCFPKHKHLKDGTVFAFGYQS